MGLFVPEDNSDMRWSLQGEDIVLIFEHILKGESLTQVPKEEVLPNGEKDTYMDIAWVKTGEQLLYDTGIQQVSTCIYSFLNRNTYLSNLSEMRSMMLARDTLLAVNKKLFVDAEKMGLKAEDYEHIMTELEDLVIPALLRPLEEGERKFQAKRGQEYKQINTSGSGAQMQGGLFQQVR